MPLVKWGLVAFVALAVAAVVGLLWKPSAANRAGGRPALLEALLRSGAASTVADLLVDGNGTLILSEADIAGLLDACLNRNDPTVPSAISRQVRRKVPDWVTGVSGCLIEQGQVNLYFRCGMRVTVYVTLSGTLRAADGSLFFKPEGTAVGLFPLPQGLFSRILATEETTLVAADQLPVRVVSVTQGEHAVTVKFEQLQEDFR